MPCLSSNAVQNFLRYKPACTFVRHTNQWVYWVDSFVFAVSMDIGVFRCAGDEKHVYKERHPALLQFFMFFGTFLKDVARAARTSVQREKNLKILGNSQNSINAKLFHLPKSKIFITETNKTHLLKYFYHQNKLNIHLREKIFIAKINATITNIEVCLSPKQWNYHRRGKIFVIKINKTITNFFIYVPTSSPKQIKNTVHLQHPPPSASSSLPLWNPPPP